MTGAVSRHSGFATEHPGQRRPAGRHSALQSNKLRLVHFGSSGFYPGIRTALETAGANGPRAARALHHLFRIASLARIVTPLLKV